MSGELNSGEENKCGYESGWTDVSVADQQERDVFVAKSVGGAVDVYVDASFVDPSTPVDTPIAIARIYAVIAGSQPFLVAARYITSNRSGLLLGQRGGARWRVTVQGLQVTNQRLRVGVIAYAGDTATPVQDSGERVCLQPQFVPPTTDFLITEDAHVRQVWGFLVSGSPVYVHLCNEAFQSQDVVLCDDDGTPFTFDYRDPNPHSERADGLYFAGAVRILLSDDPIIPTDFGSGSANYVASAEYRPVAPDPKASRPMT